jgi:outer membrane protein assembly factor BamB
VKYQVSSDFVNVVRDRDGLFAACAGELFALDPMTGTIIWHEPLKGLGTGLVTIASDLGGASATTVIEEDARKARESGDSGGVG